MPTNEMIQTEFVAWPWLSTGNEMRPFQYLGLLNNSLRNPVQGDQWVLIKDTEDGKIHEVLASDLKELSGVTNKPLEQKSTTKKYRCERNITAADGTQEFEVKADSLEEAREKFAQGDGELVVSNCEVIDLDEYDLDTIYQESE